jgi:hypothetical protein
MTDEIVSPAALLDEQEFKARRAEEAARKAPPPRIMRKSAPSQREALANLLGEVIAHERQLHKEALDNLDRRITALEARPTLAARGVWKPKANYQEGDCVTDKGALWVCTSAVTGARPGTSHCWRLAVKSGAIKGEDAT